MLYTKKHSLVGPSGLSCPCCRPVRGPAKKSKRLVSRVVRRAARM